MSDSLNKFPFQQEVEKKFEKWVDVLDEDIKEALNDLTGDTYFQMRKMQSQVLTLVEQLIITGKYGGFKNKIPLTESDLQILKDGGRIDEDLKLELKNIIEGSWFSILNKQKVGIDKLFIALNKKNNN